MTNYPKQWEIFPLETLVDVLDNLRVPVNTSERSKRLGSVPYYGATGQVGTIDEAIFNEELLVLGEDGVQFFDQNKPKAYKITGPAWVNNHAHVLRPKRDRVLQNFLLHFLNQFNYAGYANGTTRLKLTQGAMNRIPVPLPSIEEQIKIVELLEDHLSRLDAAITDVKQARIKAAQFRKALLHSIFEGIYSETSDTWEKKAIGDFAAVKGGKRLPKGTKWSDEPTLHPYIRATDIKFGQINNKDLVHVPDSIWKSISRYIVEENDVVITIAGTIGEIAVVPQSLAGANLTENAAKLVFDHEYVLPSYLAMYLQSPSVQQEFKELSRATTQAKLALYRIATVEVPVPTIDEQRRIMELLDEKLKYLTSSLNQFSDFESHVASLRRSLLQAAFTGQLTKGVISV